MKTFALISLALLAGLPGCTSYRPLPLAERTSAVDSVSHLTVDVQRLPFISLAAHRFDPSDGLDMTETAMVAVVNNPELKLARDDARITHAQAFATGLLPDPQFSLSRDYPQSTAAGTTSAYSVGLAYDLTALVSHSAAASAARNEHRMADLTLLWQEWQVVAQARLLFSRVVSQQQQLQWLRQYSDQLAELYAKAKDALEAGNITLDSANGTLAAWQDAVRQLDELQRQQLRTRHELNALLGLAPDVLLTLVDDDSLAVPDDAAIKQALEQLPQRRPDLLAFQAGYAAQDARYRQAILSQFPALSLGFNRARDTSGLLTHGFTLSLDLPLLNGNRGNIRIEKATRQRMHDEYQNRLNTAHNDVATVMSESRLLVDQLQTTEAALPDLDRAADNGLQALAEGNLAGPDFAALQLARISKHLEVANLRQSLLESRIALLTLLGGDFSAQSVSSERNP